MEITGRIIAVLEPRRGVSKSSGNEWVCGQYVLETQEQYSKKMFFEVFGSDRVQQFNIQMGEVLTVSFDIDAHEYNGRWFNSVRAFRVDRTPQQAVGGSVPPVAGTEAPAAAPEAPFPPSGEGEDLPF